VHTSPVVAWNLPTAQAVQAAAPEAAKRPLAQVSHDSALYAVLTEPCGQAWQVRALVDPSNVIMVPGRQASVGLGVGAAVGCAVGAAVGACEGTGVGPAEGAADGAGVGPADGLGVGRKDGVAVGLPLGLAVGAAEGTAAHWWQTSVGTVWYVPAGQLVQRTDPETAYLPAAQAMHWPAL
jgi:hypothetical protein